METKLDMSGFIPSIVSHDRWTDQYEGQNSTIVGIQYTLLNHTMYKD